MAKDRTKIYTSEDNIEKHFLSLSNKYFKAIGKDFPSKAIVPISTVISALFILKNFLDSVFASAIFLLLLLSILLIYSLMLSDVEEKTYEFGMLRALGFKKKSLISLLLIQALLFGFSGLVIGLIFSFICNSFIASRIFDFTLEQTNFQLHWSAIIMGFALGIFMPIISNIVPITRALSKTLKDSLDLYHRVINEMTVQVLRLEKLGISFSQFVISITLISTGIITYYFAPLAFVYRNFALFLAIMNMILILMILGFTILASLLQGMFEYLLVKLFILIAKRDKALESVVLKNMSSHKKRNTKTTLMFCIAISFLIFAGAGLKLQTKGIENSMRMSVGADLTVNLSPGEKTGLKEYELRNFLENYKKSNPGNLGSYSFGSFSLSDLPYISESDLSPLSGYPKADADIQGIDEDFPNSIDQKFYLPIEYDNLNYQKLSGGKKNGFQGKKKKKIYN